MPVGTPLVSEFADSLDQWPAVGREHVRQEHGLECRLLFPHDPLAGPSAGRLSSSLQHSQQRVGTRAFRLVRGPGPSGFPDCPAAFVLGVRGLGVRGLGIGGWDVISISASAAFALPSHCGQVTLAMSTVSSSCGAWAPQTVRPLLVSFSSRLPSLVEYDQCR